LGFLCNTAVGDTGPTFWVTAEQQTGDDLLAAAQCSVGYGYELMAKWDNRRIPNQQSE